MLGLDHSGCKLNTIDGLLRTQEQKNIKDEEDEQNDATIHEESITGRRICHKGIASLRRINLVSSQKPKKRLSCL